MPCDLCRGTDRNRPAAVEDLDAGADAEHERDIVLDEQNSTATLLRNLCDETAKLFALVFIQARCGLVEEQV